MAEHQKAKTIPQTINSSIHPVSIKEEYLSQNCIEKCIAAFNEIKQNGREANPDASRCMNAAKDYDYKSICHQSDWERKYWNLLNLSEFGKSTLNRCPAATAGYQLFRQQALAEGIMKSGRFSFVASSVAFDNRNTDLKKCLKSTGLTDFQTEWGKLFDGNSGFTTWTHQEWVQFVRENQVNDEFEDWLKYLNRRYEY
jgi:hypothetical protein